MSDKVQEAAEKARRIAEQIRKLAPEQAAAIDAAIAELLAGERDGLVIDVQVSGRLEKFDGDMQPGQTPVEVIEFSGSL